MTSVCLAHPAMMSKSAVNAANNDRGIFTISPVVSEITIVYARCYDLARRGQWVLTRRKLPGVELAAIEYYVEQKYA